MGLRHFPTSSFCTKEEIAESGKPRAAFRAAIFCPLDVITFRDELEVDVIEDTDFHVDRRDRQGLHRLGIGAVIRVAEQIHLELEMAGVD